MELVIAVVGAIAALVSAVAALWKAASKAKIAKAKLQSSEQTIIESLGSEDLSVRINSIHKLHELAIKKPNRSKEILEILCAHLRSQTSEIEYQEKYKTEPSEEISSLLELLTSKESALRKVVEENDNGKYILNFRRAFLNGADLHSAWLKSADLSHAKLQNSNLSKAQMQGAKLQDAQMQEVNLQEAQMQEARLRKAQMQGARLFRVQMQGAFMEGACMPAANLKEARMQGVDLSSAELYVADLERAHMQGANLRTAQLQGVNLRGTKLHGVNLMNAQMQMARLHGTELQGAILMGTQLQGADLKHVNLRGAGITSITWTRRYEGLKSRIELRRRKSTELNNTVIFSGGLSQVDKESIYRALEKSYAYYKIDSILRWVEDVSNGIKEWMKLDVGTPPSYEIPKGVITGVLNDDEVDKIIEEYEKAMAWEQDDAESG